MKPERIVIGLAASLLVAGFMAWAAGGASVFRDVSVWLWLGAFGVRWLGPVSRTSSRPSHGSVGVW